MPKSAVLFSPIFWAGVENFPLSNRKLKANSKEPSPVIPGMAPFLLKTFPF
jgi:hypothetical protein